MVGSPLRVLIVEDDDVTRQMLSTAFEEAPFETLVALDGLHALRTTIATEPEVVLLDLGLPTLDGTGYLKRWRERDAHARDVPIIVMSGLPYGRQMADELGAVKFFRKPFDVDEVIEAVRACAHR